MAWINSIFRSNTNRFWLALGLILWVLVVREASRVPVTHDEVNTISLSQVPVWDIVTYKDPIPNNHILNTLLIKVEMAILGDSLLISRLHNVLAFLPFFLFSVLLARRLFADLWLQFALVGLITMQPYMLDFFAVARGYGLSVAFEVMSLYFLFARLESGRFRDLILTMVCAALGVYANFTLLNLYFPMLLVLIVHGFLRYRHGYVFRWKTEATALVGISAVLGALSLLPFMRMMETRQFVYWGTAGFLEDTARPMIAALRSGTEYFRWSNEHVYIILMVLISILILSGLLLWKFAASKRDALAVFGLLGLTVLYNHLQFWLMDVPFLNARTALFLIPLVSLAMGMGLSAWVNFRPGIGFAAVLVVACLSVQHVVRGFNGRSIYEWYYDENTYDVLRDINYMIETEQLTKPVKLNCHWIFYPSLSYHIGRQCPDAIELVPYHKEIQKDTDALFYYTQSDERDALQEKYGPVREYGWGSRFLLRRK